MKSTFRTNKTNVFDVHRPTSYKCIYHACVRTCTCMSAPISFIRFSFSHPLIAKAIYLLQPSVMHVHKYNMQEQLVAPTIAALRIVQPAICLKLALVITHMYYGRMYPKLIAVLHDILHAVMQIHRLTPGEGPGNYQIVFILSCNFYGI